MVNKIQNTEYSGVHQATATCTESTDSSNPQYGVLRASWTDQGTRLTGTQVKLDVSKLL